MTSNWQLVRLSDSLVCYDEAHFLITEPKVLMSQSSFQLFYAILIEVYKEHLDFERQLWVSLSRIFFILSKCTKILTCFTRF